MTREGLTAKVTDSAKRGRKRASKPCSAATVGLLSGPQRAWRSGGGVARECEAVREVWGERAGWVGGGDRRCSALPYRVRRATGLRRDRGSDS